MGAPCIRGDANLCFVHSCIPFGRLEIGFELGDPRRQGGVREVGLRLFFPGGPKPQEVMAWQGGVQVAQRSGISQAIRHLSLFFVLRKHWKKRWVSEVQCWKKERVVLGSSVGRRDGYLRFSVVRRDGYLRSSKTLWEPSPVFSERRGGVVQCTHLP